MNTKQKGDITEVECILAFMKEGYAVSIPYGDRNRYDFIVDINGKFIRVQCKTSNTDDDGASFSFNCRSSHRANGKFVRHYYNKDEIDYFSTIFNNHCYLIPVEECGISEKRLRLHPPRNNQNQNLNWAEKYELSHVIKNIKQ